MGDKLDIGDEIFSFDAIEYEEENEDDENEKQNDKADSPIAEIWTEKVGPAPTDYLTVVQTTVLSVPATSPRYVLVWCHPRSLEYYVSRSPVIKDKKLVPQENRGEPDEAYEQVTDARKSKYFNEIFMVDRILDRKIRELKEYERDTKYTPHCLRIVQAWGKYLDLYAERYLGDNPEQNVYLQVHSRNGKYLYTASHESYARLHELGNMYEAYFGKPPKENYFIKTLSLKDLPANYYKYAYQFKELKHLAMAEKMEWGQPLPEFFGKKLKRSPILTSVRGGPAVTVDGALTEATIDVNPAIRFYAIVIHCDTKPDFTVLSKHSRFNDCIPERYHAFDFDWKDVVFRYYESRESACSDKVYGNLFTCIYKLNEDIAKSKAPYCWRKGMDDPYGFSNITFSDSVGDEMDVSEWGINFDKKPANMRLMSETHPSAAVKIDNYETVPLVP